MSHFSPEQKYVVFKTEDVLSYACDEVPNIQRINQKIQEGRIQSGKKPNQYLVLNLDEPYIHTVLDLLELFGQKIDVPVPCLDTPRE